jgi:hypothetical protein
VLTHFAEPAPVEYLALHSSEYVITVWFPLLGAELPRFPDGSVDDLAIPELIFGPERVIRHPDGSADFVGISESEERALDRRVLHRATCETLRDHDDHYQMICGTRAELEADVMKDYDKICPVCL